MRSKISSMCDQERVEIEDLDPARTAVKNGGVGVGLEQRPQRPLVVPRPEGVSLDDGVGVLAAHAGLDQPQEHAAREHEAVRRLEVPQHPVGVDLEPLDQPAGAVEHVVEGDRRVGQDDPLGRRVRDVALVPEGDVLERPRGRSRAAPARGRRSARTRSGSACAASPRSPSGPRRTARTPRAPRCAGGGGSRGRTARAWRRRRRPRSGGPRAGRGRRPGSPPARGRGRAPGGPTPRRGDRCWRRRPQRRTAFRRGRRRAQLRAARARGAARRASRAASGRTWSARRARRACGRSSAYAGAPRRVRGARRRRRRRPRAGSGPRRRAGAPAPCRRRRTT